MNLDNSKQESSDLKVIVEDSKIKSESKISKVKSELKAKWLKN